MTTPNHPLKQWGAPTRAQSIILQRCGVTELQATQCWQAATRYVALCKHFGMYEPNPGLLALEIAEWHMQREPIAFTILLAFDDGNFAHDVSAINSADRHCSLRSARCYHGAAA